MESIKTTDTSVIDIAKELIVLYHSNGDAHDFSKTKVLKQLFFAQSFSLHRFNRELFSEDCEAWQYGPVVATIYTNWENRYSPLFDTSNRNLDLFSQTIIEIIFDITKSFSANKLSDISHDYNGAWDRCYEEGYRHVIPKEDIKNSFPTHSGIEKLLDEYLSQYKKYDDSLISDSIKDMSFLC